MLYILDAIITILLYIVHTRSTAFHVHIIVVRRQLPHNHRVKPRHSQKYTQFPLTSKVLSKWWSYFFGDTIIIVVRIDVKKKLQDDVESDTCWREHYTGHPCMTRPL